MPKARGNADEDVRTYLLADAVEFRRLMSTTLQGYTIEGGQSVWDCLTTPVDALLENKEIEVVAVCVARLARSVDALRWPPA